MIQKEAARDSLAVVWCDLDVWWILAHAVHSLRPGVLFGGRLRSGSRAAARRARLVVALRFEMSFYLST